MLKQYIIASDATDGRQRSNSPPGNLNFKTGPPPLSDISVSVFSRLLFLAFFRLFSGGL